MERDEGGLAFPQPLWRTNNGNMVGPEAFGAAVGMTMRQWYAGQVLAGMRARPGTEVPNDAAVWCFEIADAMIAAEKARG